ncbi:TPA: hypothetical protein ACKFCW_004779 [Citrobacter farmeri]
MSEFNIEDLEAVIAQGREGSLAQMLALQLKSQIRKCEQMAADNEKAMYSLRQADAAVKLAHEKFSALAAENARLKQSKPSLKTMMSALDVFYVDEDVPESAMLAAYNILRGAVETPVTEAFLAEVRAQGVEMCSAEIQKQTWDEREGDGMVAAIDAMEIYAAQLHKGVQS